MPGDGARVLLSAGRDEDGVVVGDEGARDNSENKRHNKGGVVWTLNLSVGGLFAEATKERRRLRACERGESSLDSLCPPLWT